MTSSTGRFRRYVDQGTQPAGLVRCPCCAYPTLARKGAFDVCPICWWEDDGQDDHDADQPSNGPNGDHSLLEARANFEHHGDMYRLDASRIDAATNPSAERKALLRYLEAHASGRPLDLPTLRSLVDAALALPEE